MAIVGGFLGGGVEMVPAGYSQLCLQWNTDDGTNIDGVSFQVSRDEGGYNQTVQAQSDGRTDIIVPVGTYTVKVIHQGAYDGDAPQKVVAESTQSYLVLFHGRVSGSGVTFIGPACDATYRILDSASQSVASGSGWSSSMAFSLSPGQYTLELTLYGYSNTMEFSVIAQQVVEVGTDAMFCNITLTNGSGLAIEVTYNDYAIFTNNATTNTFPVLQSSSSKSIKGNVSLAYSGASSSKLATMSTISVTPNAQSKALTAVITGVVVTITESGTLKIPCDGSYHILAIGGGGGGGGYYSAGSYIYASGGGGGGHVSDTVETLDEGNYTITIGEGGNGGGEFDTGEAGGATSFGTIVSASGGSGGNAGGNGGNGGSGGGGGSGSGHGGTASYGGGGGGGGDGGSGGIYGGAGGKGGSTGSPGEEGSSDGSSDFYGSSSTSSGGSGGSGGTSTYSGGGGGGGRRARGGNGGASTSRMRAGGGGGGVAGGTGGNASYNGYGYGAGGAGNRGAGGGGGLSSTRVTSSSSNNSGSYGSAGASGAVRIQWMVK